MRLSLLSAFGLLLHVCIAQLQTLPHRLQATEQEQQHFRTALREHQYHLYRAAHEKEQRQIPGEELGSSRPLGQPKTLVGDSRKTVTTDGQKVISQQQRLRGSNAEQRPGTAYVEDERQRAPYNEQSHPHTIPQPYQILQEQIQQEVVGKKEDPRDLVFTFPINPTSQPIAPSVEPSAAPSVAAPSGSPTKPVISSSGALYYGNPDVTTGPWPECIGWEGQDCKSYLETVTTDSPKIAVTPSSKEMEYNHHRVKVFISVEGLVMRVPMRG